MAISLAKIFSLFRIGSDKATYAVAGFLLQIFLRSIVWFNVVLPSVTFDESTCWNRLHWISALAALNICLLDFDIKIYLLDVRPSSAGTKLTKCSVKMNELRVMLAVCMKAIAN